MPGLTAEEILGVWEHGEGRPQWQRALLLAAQAARPLGVQAVARLGLGERDRLILALREETFGGEIRAASRCPACGERVECSVRAAELGADLASPPRTNEPREWIWGWFRLPDTEDIAAVSASATPDLDLLHRCAEGAPDEALAAWEAHLETEDPLADLVLRLECGSCRHCWEAPFDAATLVWGELRAAATRILRDVHTLASRYGWSEEDVLRMSARRRRMYVDLEGAG